MKAQVLSRTRLRAAYLRQSGVGTQRYYMNPGLAAGFIGALIRLNPMLIESEGSSYEDASCFPSTTHVNGEAIDLYYKGYDENIKIVDAMLDFGFKAIVGPNYSYLKREGIEIQLDHNNHFHFYKFKLKSK